MLGASGWLMVTVVNLLPTVSTVTLRVERNEKDIERSYRLIEMVNRKLDIAAEERFRGSDGKALELKLQGQLDKHQETLTRHIYLLDRLTASTLD